MNIEIDSSIILGKINRSLKGFFDTFHFAGGNSKEGGHCSTVIPCHYHEIAKKFFFVILPYDSKFHNSESKNENNKKNGETPTETALRELTEETGLIGKKDNLILSFEKSVKDNRKGHEFDYHHKYFYLLMIFSGSLFDFGDDRNPIDGETGTPIMVPVDMVEQFIFSGHYDGFSDTIKRILDISSERASQDRDFAYALNDLEKVREKMERKKKFGK